MLHEHRPEPSRHADPGRHPPGGRPVRRGRRSGGRVRQPRPRLLRRPRVQPDVGARTPSPSTRARSTAAAHLSWGAPVFINQTTAPSTLNDKEWIAVDSHASSPFRDNVYVTWTRFKFNGHNGAYTQSPIFFVRSTDGGTTFSAPKSISGNVLYDQGSRPVVGPDGTLYVFWNGSTRLASLNSTYVVKSTDGGTTFSKPVAISQLTDTDVLKDTAFRVNSFPAAAAAPNGDLYATWTTEVLVDGTANYDGEPACADWLGGDPEDCYSVAVYSKSTDGGATWTRAGAGVRARRRARRSATRSPSRTATRSVRRLRLPGRAGLPGRRGRAERAGLSRGVLGRRRSRRGRPAPPVRRRLRGRITCDTLGDYIHNARLDYKVRDLTTTVTQNVNTHLINTRHGFGGGFFGDYTDIAVGSDNVFHALWTDSNDSPDRRLVLRVRVHSDPDQPGGRRHRDGQLLARRSLSGGRRLRRRPPGRGPPETAAGPISGRPHLTHPRARRGGSAAHRIYGFPVVRT